MKAVLISIKPKWCELIANKKKTIEVRKTRPKLKTPFKCYIYCTKSKEVLFNVFLDQPKKEVEYLCGKIIGEFVCDKVSVFPYGEKGIQNNEYWIIGRELEQSCLTYDELKEYGRGKPLYGWHITDFKIYDKPKDLGEFNGYCIKKQECFSDYVRHCNDVMHIDCKCRESTHPPQSWRYIESLED